MLCSSWVQNIFDIYPSRLMIGLSHQRAIQSCEKTRVSLSSVYCTQSPTESIRQQFHSDVDVILTKHSVFGRWQRKHSHGLVSQHTAHSTRHTHTHNPSVPKVKEGRNVCTVENEREALSHLTVAGGQFNFLFFLLEAKEKPRTWRPELTFAPTMSSSLTD